MKEFFEVSRADPLSAFTFALLILAAILLWSPPRRRHWWCPCFLAAMALGWLAGRVTVLGLAWLALLGIMAFAQSWLSVRWEKRADGLILFALGALMMTRYFPGFDNWKVVDAVLISSDAIPYTQYFNFNKASVGLLLMASQPHLCRCWSEWRVAMRTWLIIMPIMIPVIMGLALLFGYVHWDPKIPQVLPVFLIANFFFISMPEEVVCRGVLQRVLGEYLRGIWGGSALAIFIAALVFGLGHFKGGPLFVILATTAGIFYGVAYYASKKIESDILCHFSLNVLHALLFTFPALASAIR